MLPTCLLPVFHKGPLVFCLYIPGTHLSAPCAHIWTESRLVRHRPTCLLPVFHKGPLVVCLYIPGTHLSAPCAHIWTESRLVRHIYTYVSNYCLFWCLDQVWSCVLLLYENEVRRCLLFMGGPEEGLLCVIHSQIVCSVIPSPSITGHASTCRTYTSAAEAWFWHGPSFAWVGCQLHHDLTQCTW